MSINNIELSGISLQQLYKKSLVEVEQAKKTNKKKNTDLINYLGKNKQQIVLIVSNKEFAFLPDEELNFLLGILSACKLNMDDVGIINLEKNNGLEYERIATELKAEKVFLFGIEPVDIGLPLSFPVYQVQHFNDQVYLAAPELSNLQHDKAEKMKLWNCLKKIFSI